ncbi:Fructosamine-3-kinase [Saccharicrinis carchari]|uniref:Fructosamine-3-kinase n=1 Tax=Saccharicrinis carchari TaxID=1168039 RepID=A0A521EQX8_SACCC|nr:fructosamine kinase family protein [Saccharicrinis carchari]SMO86336.1 Fructosamine-3-kinase [Saccharicrinis carchari]
MSELVLSKVSTLLHEDIVGNQPHGGGCIADSRIITTSTGMKYFLKQGGTSNMFVNEANGLREIALSNTILTPKVVGVDNDFLLLDYIEQGPKTSETLFDLGCDLARMHQFTAARYGFYEDNFIGGNPQINTMSDSWADFYFNKRLKYQYQLSKRKGSLTPELQSKFIALEKVFHRILQDSEEKPSLLHGDLWAGNYLINKNGKGVLIDPAVYYGHREADIAMTKLFGGFSPEFYQGYNSTFPLKSGYEYRENIYLLYHVWNHLNLFGTGYYSQTINLMDFYIR